MESFRFFKFVKKNYRKTIKNIPTKAIKKPIIFLFVIFSFSIKLDKIIVKIKDKIVESNKNNLNSIEFKIMYDKNEPNKIKEPNKIIKLVGCLLPRLKSGVSTAT